MIFDIRALDRNPKMIHISFYDHFVIDILVCLLLQRCDLLTYVGLVVIFKYIAFSACYREGIIMAQPFVKCIGLWLLLYLIFSNVHFSGGGVRKLSIDTIIRQDLTPIVNDNYISQLKKR